MWIIGKDTLGKFDPRSDEAIFLGYSSHSKAYKVFNKRNLCVEKSVHVLFDESNSLIKKDAQDEEFELGLAKKDFMPTHEENKKSQEGSDTGPVSKAEMQDSEQTGGTSVEPCLEQNNNPETAQKQDPELFMNQDHQPIRLSMIIDLFQEHGSTKNLITLIKF